MHVPYLPLLSLALESGLGRVWGRGAPDRRCPWEPDYPHPLCEGVPCVSVM